MKTNNLRTNKPSRNCRPTGRSSTGFARAGLLWLALLANALLAGCIVEQGGSGGSGGSGASTVRVNLTVSADFSQAAGNSLVAALGDRLTVQPNLAGGSVNDVQAVGLEVSDAGGVIRPLRPMSRNLSSGAWEANLYDLPVGTSLTFRAEAYDAPYAGSYDDPSFTGTKIFEGQLSQTLTVSGPNLVSLFMGSIDNGIQPVLPKAAVSLPANMPTDSINDVSITVTHGSAVDYEITVTGGSLGGATTGTAEANPSSAIALTYTAPSVAGGQTLTVTLRDAADATHEVAYAFPMSIGGSGDSQVVTQFGPAVTALNFLRRADSLEVGLVLNGGVQPYTYAWSGTGTEGLNGYSASSNPAVVTSFSDTTSGTLAATVIDAAGVQAVISRTISAGDFPYDPTLIETPGALASGLALYDDFSGTGINGQKWDSGEMSRNVANGAMVLTTAAENLAAHGSQKSGWATDAHPLTFSNKIQADLTLQSASRTDARIESMVRVRAYRRSAFGTDLTNYYLFDARLRDRGNAGGVEFLAFVFRCDDPLCLDGTILPSSNLPGGNGVLYEGSLGAAPVSKTVSIEYVDTPDAEEVIITASGGLQINIPLDGEVDAGRFVAADMDIKAHLRNRITNNSEFPIGGAASATAIFDNIDIDSGTVTDDFAGGTIDNSIWHEGAAGRQLVSGAVRFTQTQADQSVGNSMALFEPTDDVLELAANVTINDRSGSAAVGNGTYARLFGFYYNDGSAGDGLGGMNGEVFAELGMSDDTVFYVVGRCEAFDCSNLSLLTSDAVPIGTVSLGSTHNLYQAWDPVSQQFIFQLDANTPVVFNPVSAGAPVVGPAKALSGKRLIGTRAALDNGETGSITATFDNVRTGGSPVQLADKLPLFEHFDNGTVIHTGRWQPVDQHAGEIQSGEYTMFVQDPGQDVETENAHIELKNTGQIYGIAATTRIDSHTGGFFEVNLRGEDIYFDTEGDGVGAQIYRTAAGELWYFLEECNGSGCTDLATAMLTSELANGDDHQLALKWDGASSFSFFLDGVQQGDPVDVSGLGASFSSANTDPIWIAGLAGDACCNSSTDSATVAIDDLSIDSNGDGTMELYDDFTGTRLDLANSYLVGERYRRIENQAMTFGFGVSDLGPYVINYLRVQNAARLRAIAADIRVDEIAVSGGGVASLRARGFLFNDGTGGPGVIGDIIGTVQMDGSQAYFTMSRCDTAGCESFTAITPPGGIVLGNVTLGSTHTLYLDWDGTVATFQLDDNPPGTFDPTSVGVFPAGPPNGQSWAIGSYTESDGVGKTAFIKGSIDNVKAW